MTLKTLKTTAITLYYLSLVGFVAFKAAEVVFEGSLLIGKSSTIAQLKAKKATLSEKKQVLQNQANQATTLASVSQDETLNEFVAITDPVRLTLPQLSSDQVALR